MGWLTDVAFAFGRVVATAVSGSQRAVLGTLRLFESSETDASAEESAEPLYGTPGVYFRPRASVAASAATGNNPAGYTEVIGFRLDDRVYPLSYRDLRLNAKVNPAEGELGLVQYLGGFVSMRTNATGDGTDVVIYTPRNNASGVATRAHAISLDTSSANESIAIVHANGHSITMNKTGSIVLMNKAGNALVEVKEDGSVLINASATVFPGQAQFGTQNPADPALEFVALATKVLTELNKVKTAFDAHVHTAPMGGGATTPPAAPMPSFAPVASTTVKAK
jgi:hypothetical protein